MLKNTQLSTYHIVFSLAIFFITNWIKYIFCWQLKVGTIKMRFGFKPGVSNVLLIRQLASYTKTHIEQAFHNFVIISTDTQ